MVSRPAHDVTGLLSKWSAGDKDAEKELFHLVYEPLRRIARRQLKGVGSGRSLQTTEVVHEAYLRLAGRKHLSWQDRAHFFAFSKAMRHILIDHARSRKYAKRGGQAAHVTLDEAGTPSAVDFEYKAQKPDGLLEPGRHFKYDLKANKPG
jgi:RNA polymerase sigma factor (TIGR02999 family)